MTPTMLHRSSRTTHLLLTGVALAVTACTDNPLSPAPTPVKSSAVQTSEGAALGELTRLVALAFAKPAIRNDLRGDLRESRHTREHKLELRAHVKGQSGGRLVAEMARAGGISTDSVNALIGRVRPLEMYMPGAANRATWAGGSDLLVASQLTEQDIPVGYDLSGARVTLSLKEAPALPTISLVPVETNFANSLDAKKFKNADDHGGTTIGTWAAAGACGGSSGVRCDVGTVLPPGVAPDGMYLTEMHVVDAHEPWIKGDPELELHVLGPDDRFAVTQGVDKYCDGEVQDQLHSAYFWNMDGNDWSAPVGSGAPLIMDRKAINDFQAKFPNAAVNLMLWEDDAGTSCDITTDRSIGQTLRDAVGPALGAGIVFKKDSVYNVRAAAKAFVIEVLKKIGTWISGNDDYVGTLIDIRGTPTEANYPRQTHVLKDGVTEVGSARIEFVWPTQANGGAFAASLTASTTATAMDQAQLQSLSATALDQYGAAMAGQPISWWSANANVATIDDNGTLRGTGAGNTIVYARTCDPNCIDRPVNVAITGPTLTGPDYAYEENATLTAGVVNPRQGSYYYVWESMECTNVSCGGPYQGIGGGWDLTSNSVFVSRYASSVNVRVTVKTSPYGSTVGVAGYAVSGAGEYLNVCTPPAINCDPY